MNRAKIANSFRIFVTMGVFPLLFYFTCFCALTYPAITKLRTHLFADKWDGLQSVWDLWWVRKAVTELHQSPWHTNYLHWPWGISLLGHTLTPFNGFATIFLPKSLPLVEAYNLVVVFAFVVGGLTAFLLAHHLSQSYWGSILGGFLFTFSSFHFAHLEGHLQMVSLEWIPLFILFWYKLISRPATSVGVAAAIALFLVILCDYYFFFYCVLAGFIIFCWRLIGEKGVPFFIERGPLISFTVFGLVSLGTSGLLAGSLLLANVRDPFLGAHPAEVFSLDLLAPFIYGGHWRFASLTWRYWARLPANAHESSVHLGLSVVILLLYVWCKRNVTRMPATRLWFSLLFFFAVLALGPGLHIWGKPIASWPLPYAWLEEVFPPLRLSGVPVRMMVMTVLAAAVISAQGFKLLFVGSYRSRAFALALLPLLFLEYLPSAITTSKLSIPAYVSALRRLPDGGGVLDTVSSPAAALFYQTVHEKPLAFGYLARIPQSVDARDRELAEAIKAKAFYLLWRNYRIRYLIAASGTQGLGNPPGVIWTDGSASIFDLATASVPGSGSSTGNTPVRRPVTATAAAGERLVQPRSARHGAHVLQMDGM